jgi:hypothetical protein
MRKEEGEEYLAGFASSLQMFLHPGMRLKVYIFTVSARDIDVGTYDESWFMNFQSSIDRN